MKTPANVTSVIAAGTPYTDTTFSTGNTDFLYFKKNTTGILSNMTNVTSKITYSRARSFLKNTTIFGANPMGGINPSPLDPLMDPYLIEDSYFLAPLASLALMDAPILKNIITQDYNAAGIFAAQVYIKGIPTVVTIDDYLAVDPLTKNTPVFA